MADPPNLRVSDQQRERAAQEIREHFAAGRLTDDELSDRIQAVYSARTEQELQGPLADLPKLPASLAQQKAELVERRRMLQRRLIQETGGGVGLFVVCTVVWLVSGGHHGHGFFWPIFVALVVLLPLLRNGWRLYGPAPELDRVELELEAIRGHNAARAQRHAARAERHAARYERRRGR
jgi:hypothetical protein